ncbi:hypothetical protein TRFO_37726 [Tritrichomonas foetus]|uniref:Protein kinase domain-containing protein n=1 Tax=Tritrichomonas foetus TaxID=1144522 RepID=A0A1J4JF92_9EUKA|nr:hypothetical protein TRFO_37726 [Tritrichomonas foetus]|eukprot:OHS96117.1 hypothetical protein TRFO_37726 [Tritrichomonas foetus]
MKTSIGPYRFGLTVGEGSFSTVRLCFLDNPNPPEANPPSANPFSLRFVTSSRPQIYACKIVSKLILKNKNVTEEMFREEVKIQRLLKHPGIVQVIDDYEDDDNFYLILEYCSGGDLLRRIIKNGKFAEKEARIIFKQILEVIKFMHQNGVCHRDIKPDNILFDENGKVKVCDFGLSTRFGHKNLRANNKHISEISKDNSKVNDNKNNWKTDSILNGQLTENLKNLQINTYSDDSVQGFKDDDLNDYITTGAGSLCYASPECIEGGSYSGRAADMWSCGVVLYAMLNGFLPWTSEDDSRLCTQISCGDYPLPPSLSDDSRRLIQSFLTVDVKRRITAAKALEHSFFIQQ